MRKKRARFAGPNKRSLIDAYRGREAELLIAAGVNPYVLDGQGWPCPFFACPAGPGRDRFRFNANTGICWCRKCLATKGGRIDLPDALQRLWGLTFSQALAAIESYLCSGSWNSPPSKVSPAMAAPSPRFLTIPTNLREAAIFYASLGVEVFPLVPGTKRPFAGSCGVRDATSNPEIISEWWHENPTSNIGLATDCWTVIDIDLHKPACWRWWQQSPKLQALLWQSAKVIQQSPRGGLHFFFKMPPERKYKSRTNADGIPGFDIKSTGGYVLLAPSVSRDVAGPGYRFFCGRELVESLSHQPLCPATIQQALDSLSWPGGFLHFLNQIESL